MRELRAPRGTIPPSPPRRRDQGLFRALIRAERVAGSPSAEASCVSVCRRVLAARRVAAAAERAGSSAQPHPPAWAVAVSARAPYRSRTASRRPSASSPPRAASNPSPPPAPLSTGFLRAPSFGRSDRFSNGVTGFAWKGRNDGGQDLPPGASRPEPDRAGIARPAMGYRSSAGRNAVRFEELLRSLAEQSVLLRRGNAHVT